jgi:predicted Zn-dependent protease
MTVVTLRPSTGSSIRPPIRPTARPVLRPTAAPVRLTRRGRRVVGGLAVAAVALAAFLLSLALSGGALASNHGSAGSPYQGMRHVVVQPGQNLWSLAAQAEPGADPRLVIPQIVSANSLAGDAIYPGEQLWVPR